MPNKPGRRQINFEPDEQNYYWIKSLPIGERKAIMNQAITDHRARLERDQKYEDAQTAHAE